MVEQVIFWTLGAVLIASALGVIIMNNAVNSVMSLLVAMLALAGFYILLGAHVVALFQVIIYIGAILVLFLFVIMILNLKDFGKKLFFKPSTGGIFIVSLALIGIIAVLFWRALISTKFVAVTGTLGLSASVHEIAVNLFSQHLLIFELTSVLLLIAAVGAILISRK